MGMRSEVGIVVDQVAQSLIAAKLANHEPLQELIKCVDEIRTFNAIDNQFYLYEWALISWDDVHEDVGAFMSCLHEAGHEHYMLVELGSDGPTVDGSLTSEPWDIGYQYRIKKNDTGSALDAEKLLQSTSTSKGV